MATTHVIGGFEVIGGVRVDDSRERQAGVHGRCPADFARLRG